MIYTHAKRYQIDLWLSEDRSGVVSRMEFDRREDAERVFSERTADGSYRAAILMEWRPDSAQWVLLRKFPG
jgi:hypothetical protein